MVTPANYVDRGGELVFRPPFVAEDVRFYGFLLDADEKALQTNLCDRYFNDPSGEPGRFRPAVPSVLLAMCRLKALRSESDPYAGQGWFAESEVAFWVLLVDTKEERLTWAFPYIWVDNAYAMAMGREVYGFPKGIGWFEIPDDHERIATMSCEALAIPEYGRESQGGRKRIIDVRRTADALPHGGWSSSEEVVRELLQGFRIFEGGGLVGNLLLAEHSLGDLLHGRLRFAFLKQFRDVARSEETCYSSLVEVVCEMTHYKGGGRLDGEFEVHIHPMDSHPIALDLGLKTGPLSPSAAFWLDFDFRIGLGQEVGR